MLNAVGPVFLTGRRMGMLKPRQFWWGHLLWSPISNRELQEMEMSASVPFLRYPQVVIMSSGCSLSMQRCPAQIFASSELRCKLTLECCMQVPHTAFLRSRKFTKLSKQSTESARWAAFWSPFLPICSQIHVKHSEHTHSQEPSSM